ncbi:MAG: hypothetical protein MPJ22_06395 [Pirellulales bacterium]|nr:hypothetical protein [Pirellulales bacterium]
MSAGTKMGGDLPLSRDGNTGGGLAGGVLGGVAGGGALGTYGGAGPFIGYDAGGPLSGKPRAAVVGVPGGFTPAFFFSGGPLGGWFFYTSVAAAERARVGFRGLRVL